MEQINMKEYLQKVMDLAIDGNTKCIISFEHTTTPEYWFQFTWDMLNVYYPFTHDPTIQLKQWDLDTYEKDDLSLVDWKANEYCTWERDPGNLDAAADFIMQYLKKALGKDDSVASWKIIES
ncbi:hypothetical protein SAMN05660461_0149 [Chitinophaga ginsengisegetis]|uniref:Uncharacterized protein n=1 Tax=Chitinophaga ginsengisegetis TaxID=393003 RepID=A0A1T5N394_9BACT|nr:hypothetical protein [Chitinophaga ginsengisegetis]SKC94926.1 hypothetical protein SAMN05660461_0149 [Chitinophaga ginsengisegetis]